MYDENNYVNEHGVSSVVAGAAIEAANCQDLRTMVVCLPGIYGGMDSSFVLKVSSVCEEHKTQLSPNKKLSEFIHVGKATEAHLLAARDLFDPEIIAGIADQIFFILKRRPEVFCRCYAAVGRQVAPSEVTVKAMSAAQLMAHVGKWAYSIVILSMAVPL
jgi:sterol-4alpha-carboxylate 3-dehydrogenase (decarboxylating)